MYAWYMPIPSTGRARLIAAQFAAGRALQCTGDGTHRHAGFIQRMQTVSLRQVQTAG